MGFFNVDIYKSGDNTTAFHVRPFSEEVKTDLDRLIRDVHKISSDTIIVECDGTYTISTNSEITEQNFFESFWGMLFRRFYSESKRVCVDPITEEKFYAIIFSEEFIEPCERLLAA